MSKFYETLKKYEKSFWRSEDEKRFVPHSTSYHNYFQGWSERKVIGTTSGTYKIEREYTAHYIAFTEEKSKWKQYKLIYIFLFCSSAIALLLALFSGARSNDWSWSSVFGVLNMLMIVMQVIPTGNFMVAPLYMKLGEYNISVKRIGQYAKPTAVFAVLYSATGILWCLVNGTVPMIEDVMCILFQIFNVISSLVLCVWINNMKYRRVDNESSEKMDFEANEIW